MLQSTMKTYNLMVTATFLIATAISANSMAVYAHGRTNMTGGVRRLAHGGT